MILPPKTCQDLAGLSFVIENLMTCLDRYQKQTYIFLPRNISMFSKDTKNNDFMFPLFSFI